MIAAAERGGGPPVRLTDFFIAQIGLVRSRANLVQDLSPGAGEVARGHEVT